jgi:hypothetical protein
MGRDSRGGGRRGGDIPPPLPPQRTVYCGVTNALGRSFARQAVYTIATIVQ